MAKQLVADQGVVYVDYSQRMQYMAECSVVSYALPSELKPGNVMLFNEKFRNSSMMARLNRAMKYGKAYFAAIRRRIVECRNDWLTDWLTN